jgi:hypothetical protein
VGTLRAGASEIAQLGANSFGKTMAGHEHSVQQLSECTTPIQAEVYIHACIQSHDRPKVADARVRTPTLTTWSPFCNSVGPTPGVRKIPRSSKAVRLIEQRHSHEQVTIRARFRKERKRCVERGWVFEFRTTRPSQKRQGFRNLHSRFPAAVFNSD